MLALKVQVQRECRLLAAFRVQVQKIALAFKVPVLPEKKMLII